MARRAAPPRSSAGARGEAFTSDLRGRPLLATKLRLGPARGGRRSRRRGAGAPLLAAEGRLVRGRPRGRGRTASTGGPDAVVGGELSWTTRPLGPNCYAAGSRRSAPRRRPTSAGGRAGRLARRAPRWLPFRTPWSTSTASGYVLADDVDPPPRPGRGSRSSRRSTRRRWAGRSAMVPRRARGRCSTERQRRPHRLVRRPGRRRLDAAKGRRVVFRLLEDVGPEPPAVEAEAARLAGGSATPGSRRASCRRSSARSPADRSPTPRPGRSPSRSRGAGSARCPRRSGRASRRA